MILVAKIAIRRARKSPDLKVNDKQLQTINLVYIFRGKDTPLFGGI